MQIFSKQYLSLLNIFIFSLHLLIYAGNTEYGINGMVVSDHELASKVGIDILKKGGNAIDAAVGVGFALAVTFPYAGNIGGGGFMVLKLEDGTETTIDFRETAPALAHRDMYLNDSGKFDPSKSQNGWSSAAVPGSVAGLIYAHEKYGSLNFSEVIQPSIDLAENGFILKQKQVERFNKYLEKLWANEATKNVFSDHGIPYKVGDIFVQSDLAETLLRIRDNGNNGFYNGITAELIIESAKKNGGIITFDDLKNYRPIERKPILVKFDSLKIISMAPPSSGGIAIAQAIGILRNFEITKNDFGSSKYLHLLIETLKHVYADRSKHLGDPDYYDVPVSELLENEYSGNIAGKITDSAIRSEDIGPTEFFVKESDETTHYSVVDKKGNAVSVTTTINSAYGSKVVVDKAGFLLNNEMDDFSSKPGEPNQFGLVGNEANSIAPNKRMLSSMTPTILLKNGKPFMVVGSPGGSRIITAVLQVINNVVFFDMPLEDAVNQSRIHHQWLPDSVFYDEFGFVNDVKEALITKGHILGSPKVIGRVNAILIDEKNKIIGCADRRGAGKAVGY